MTATTTHPKAVTGRRVIYAYYNARKPHPGVITGTMTAINGALLVLVRLDGTRSSIRIPADQENLHYLNEVGPVPDLPMGSFTPDGKTVGFDFVHEGVLVCEFEDGDMVAVTADRAKAEAAIATYMRERCDVDDESTVNGDLTWLKPRWVTFDWEPEDAECAWLMNPASEGADQALQVHYLPY